MTEGIKIYQCIGRCKICLNHHVLLLLFLHKENVLCKDICLNCMDDVYTTGSETIQRHLVDWRKAWKKVRLY